LIQRYNSDLANGLGNLASRTINMLNQFCVGAVPEPDAQSKGPADWNARMTIQACRAAYDNFAFSSALTAAWTYVSDANKLIVEAKPWELAKSASTNDQERLRGTLYTVAQVLRTLCVVLHSIMPATVERLWKQLGEQGDIPFIEDSAGNPVAQLIAPGTKVGKPEPIFPRLDKAATLAKLEELAEIDRGSGERTVGALREAPLSVPVQLDLAERGGEPDKSKEAFIAVPTENKPDAAPTPAPASQAPSPQSPAPSPQPPAPSLISIEEFAKVEMRVGEVKAAEHVPGASKLLRLMVDIGTEVRQVVAGLAEYYRPENLIGMKVVVVTNLQPRRLRGVESNGMIIAASEGEHGRPVLVTLKEDVPNGARLK